MRGIHEDLAGQTFGRLKVLNATDERSWGSVIWRCRCRCGKVRRVRTRNLKSGNTVSCGCYHKELVKKPNKER